ncbi:MAG: hypothetical protein ACK4M9_21065 [Anaerobacillus sp.]|uniref:hypothetical protein n=1 Tax=Anaerobacillus sp. TaxID=1872506 RepID=UPI00391A6DD4
MRKQYDSHDLDDRLKRLDVDSNWKEEHRHQLKDRILRDVQKNKPGTSHFGRFPYKYYFSLGAAAIILMILVGPSLQTFFSEWSMAISGDGPDEASVMLRVVLTLIIGIFFLVGMVLIIRNNEQANKLFWDTNGFWLLSDTIRELVRKCFKLLVILQILYLFHIVLGVSFLFLLGTGPLAIWVERWIENRVIKLSYPYLIQIIGSLLVILYFTFQMFTPYFFPGAHLINSGLEKIEIYYEAIGDNDLSIEERIELAKIPYGSRAKTQFSHWQYMEEQGEDIFRTNYKLIELVDFSRRYHDYTLIVEVEIQWYEDEMLQIERDLWDYTFTREEGDFKIIGSGRLSEYQKSLLNRE